MELRDEHSALAVVIIQEKSQNRVLMIKNHFGWVFPKGHIEEGEDGEAAAIRECKEESGIDISNAKCYGQVYEYTTVFDHTHLGMSKKEFLVYSSGADAIRKLISVYCFVLDHTQPFYLEDGFIEGSWANEIEAYKLLKHEDAKMALAKSLETIKSQQV